jgi:hypothetical protein
MTFSDKVNSVFDEFILICGDVSEEMKTVWYSENIQSRLKDIMQSNIGKDGSSKRNKTREIRMHLRKEKLLSSFGVMMKDIILLRRLNKVRWRSLITRKL